MILNLGMVDKIIVFICVLTSFFVNESFDPIQEFQVIMKLAEEVSRKDGDEFVDLLDILDGKVDDDSEALDNLNEFVSNLDSSVLKRKAAEDFSELQTPVLVNVVDWP